MAMSEYETQKFLVMEQEIDQVKSVLAQLIEELRAAKVIKPPKKAE